MSKLGHTSSTYAVMRVSGKNVSTPPAKRIGFPDDFQGCCGVGGEDDSIIWRGLEER